MNLYIMKIQLVSDALVDFNLGYIYNYKLKDKNIENDELVITYYGLYAYQDEIGPTTLSNDKNIERILIMKKKVMV